MSEPMKRRKFWIGTIPAVMLGIAMCLLSIANITNISDRIGNSAWTLPMLVFVFGFGE